MGKLVAPMGVADGGGTLAVGDFSQVRAPVFYLFHMKTADSLLKGFQVSVAASAEPAATRSTT